MRTRFVTALLLAVPFCLSGQKLNPVKWTLTVEPPSAPPQSTVIGRLTATLEPGWHIYSLTTPEGGPTPTVLKLAEGGAATDARFFQPKPASKFDPNFKVDTEVFEGEVSFPIRLTVGSSSGDVSINARYQACTDKECLPRRATATAALKVDPKAPVTTASMPPGFTEFTGVRSTASSKPASTGAGADQSLPAYLALAFGLGLAAIFTPCVFPMIPITLSFFLNRGETLKHAAIFCIGIVTLFTGIGLSLTAILGPFAVVQLGSNPWVNAFIALVFLVFGLSLLGAFEITLPSSLLTKMDQASQRGGIAGTLLMGLTFSLTSFACVGPFVGTLLAGSVQRGGVQPALGMMTFAAGLASPFFLLALFPSYLQKLPRSGGWLARVKVVLGFVVLAVMFKYLSSIDKVLQWNILTRERFLAAWVVLFLLAGLYLLGFLRMEGIGRDDHLGVGRMLAGAAFLVFAISLIPGMFGARLGELDSFVPIAAEGSGIASSGGRSTSGLVWMKNDFAGAAAKARAEGKLIFVSFTGYACSNCHWMKSNMFSRPEIAEALQNYVLLELYTDGTDSVSEQNQQMQEQKFGTVAIPYYALMDPDRKVVNTFAGLTRQVPEYLAFLRSGVTESASLR